MNLTKNFTLEELVASETASRFRIDNTPSGISLLNLGRLAQSLEEVRALLGRPIHINSGYRSVALNSAVHGAKTSAHTYGLAADIICPDFGTPLQVCQFIAESEINFDQVILEFYEPKTNQGWCHFAIIQQGLVGRHETLTINGQGTKLGLEA